jgi:hypothetical protein
MPADPAGGCGCALLLAVCAIYFAGLALYESGLLYPGAAVLVAWLVFGIVRRFRRHWGDGT